MRHRKGFTLIEMCLVMVLLAIIAAIAGLNLHAYTLNRNLKTAARDIAYDISQCKERAVSESVQYQITFAVDALNPSSYNIKQGTATGAPFTTITTKSPSSFSPDIRITAANFNGNQYIQFLTRGIVVDQGSITLRNSRNSTAMIAVGTTGRANVTFPNIQ